MCLGIQTEFPAANTSLYKMTNDWTVSDGIVQSQVVAVWTVAAMEMMSERTKSV